jgi:hypothetical protein
MKSQFTNNKKNSNLNSINEQARFLMVMDRKRQSNRQTRMLERAAAEVGLQ